MIITIHARDKYNFDKGKSDIKTGTPDAVNGRFQEVGWAKSFYTKDEFTREVTWGKGKINKTSKTKKVKSR